MKEFLSNSLLKSLVILPFLSKFKYKILSPLSIQFSQSLYISKYIPTTSSILLLNSILFSENV
ncbi:hypothetical protein HOG21_02655 [bacterium]|nr:hypothetical protein [bacterium]